MASPSTIDIIAVLNYPTLSLSSSASLLLKAYFSCENKQNVPKIFVLARKYFSIDVGKRSETFIETFNIFGVGVSNTKQIIAVNILYQKTYKQYFDKQQIGRKNVSSLTINWVTSNFSSSAFDFQR